MARSVRRCAPSAISWCRLDSRPRESVSAAIAEACKLTLEEISLPSGKKVSTQWVLAFFSEYPLQQAALDDLMAFENPMVSEGIEAPMQKKGKSRSAQSA